LASTPSDILFQCPKTDLKKHKYAHLFLVLLDGVPSFSLSPIIVVPSANGVADRFDFDGVFGFFCRIGVFERSREAPRFCGGIDVALKISRFVKVLEQNIITGFV
jgi:hypothetical protein